MTETLTVNRQQRNDTETVVVAPSLWMKGAQQDAQLFWQLPVLQTAALSYQMCIMTLHMQSELLHAVSSSIPEESVFLQCGAHHRSALDGGHRTRDETPPANLSTQSEPDEKDSNLNMWIHA